MAYRVYIKQSNKIECVLVTSLPLSMRDGISYLCIALLLLSAGIFFSTNILHTPVSATIQHHPTKVVSTVKPKLSEDTETTMPIQVDEVLAINQIDIPPDPVLTEDITEVLPWETIIIQSGDSLSLIFERKKLPAQLVHNIMALGKDTNVLRSLKPGQKIRLLLLQQKFSAMQYDINITNILHIKKLLDDSLSAEILKKDLEVKIKSASGVINDSLFIAGKNAGLSDKLIMKMIGLYSWDIDFALEVRQGDQFHIIYEEVYDEIGKQVRQGNILAATFINQGKPFSTVRYTHDNEESAYYTPTGNTMRQAFLRTPVKFNRISSHFNLRRKHPILNTIRAHKGVDYAAPSRTIVKATGRGVVKFAANKGGYGKTIIIQHGDQYTTLYSHLSRYAKGIKIGKQIEQGQTIGYVGMTGLATGPHLHYEFRINGTHRNPLTVQLPKTDRIPSQLMSAFQQKTEPLLTQLHNMQNQVMVAENNVREKSAAVVALNKKNLSTETPPADL